MYVSDLIIAFISILILVVFIINRKKPMLYIKINLVLLMSMLFIHFGHGYLPYILQLPINSFKITHHNTNLKSLKSFGLSKKYIIQNYEATSVKFEGFAGKKMFYDKDKDFYILMDGIVFTPTQTKRTFHFHLTWSKAELSIDSKLIKEIDRTQSFDYTFTPGFHHVTIKVYNTDVISAKMFVSMTKHQPIISDENITQAIEPYLEDDMNLYYAFGYDKKDITLTSQSKQTIAFLKASSGGPAFWDISNCDDGNLKAIVYSGVGSTIKTDCKEQPMLLRANKLPEVTKLPKLSECNDMGPFSFSCPNGPEKIDRLNKKIKQYTGKYLTGLTITNVNKNLILPQIKLDSKKYKELKKIASKIEEAKDIAKKRRINPFYDLKQNSWVEILKVDNKQIPLNKFRAFYMQLQDPKRVIYSENVASPSILYSRKEKFHNITPDHFMALWIGDFEFKKSTLKEITLSVSWAKVKLIIDGKVIYEGGESKIIPYTFTKGKHRIEIQYRNNYGQVDFLYDMLDPVKEIDDAFKSLIKQNTKIYFLSTYGSWRADHTLNVELQDSDKEVVLFISSYEPIYWNIKNAKNLQAIVYNAYGHGGKITTDNANTKIYHDKKLGYASRLMPYCYDGPVVHCEGKYNFRNAVKHIVKRTGRKPDGFSSTEVPSLGTKNLKHLDKKKNIIVPQIILDVDMYKKIDNAMASLK